ncbi:MAG TPA: PQQ-binding-like beta-propeller repeat protein [Candidatus Sulfotelmatobacter sp.]
MNSSSVCRLVTVCVFLIAPSIATSAFAASVSTTPPSGPPTAKVTATGSGFPGGETVNLQFDSAAIASATADSQGGFTQLLLIPKSAQPGAHTLAAVGQTSGASASFSFTVSTNWPAFKNELSRVGTNPFENTINKSNAKFLQLSWVGIMGDLVDFSSPAVVNGVVYVGSFDGRLYAFNANGCNQSSCQPLWSGITGNDITSSPAVANGVVYIGSADHKLYAFNAKGCGKSTCPALWTGKLASGVIESSALVANGVVYTGAYDGKLYAFNANGCGGSSCAPLWTGATTGSHITSSPALGNGVIYIGSEDGKLNAFGASGCGASSCPPLWTGQAGSAIFESSPAVFNGVVYIGSFDGNLYTFPAAGCGQSSCSPLWIGPTNGIIESSPSVANGVVYIGSDDFLYAFEAAGCGQASCQPLWFGMADGQQASIVSAPAIANGLIYASENNGMVMVFSDAGCAHLPCLPLNQLMTQNEPIVSSSPAVVNGTVYVGSANQNSPPIGRLYVFKLSN